MFDRKCIDYYYFFQQGGHDRFRPSAGWKFPKADKAYRTITLEFSHPLVGHHRPPLLHTLFSIVHLHASGKCCHMTNHQIAAYGTSHQHKFRIFWSSPECCCKHLEEHKSLWPQNAVQEGTPKVRGIPVQPEKTPEVVELQSFHHFQGMAHNGIMCFLWQRVLQACAILDCQFRAKGPFWG